MWRSVHKRLSLFYFLLLSPGLCLLFFPVSAQAEHPRHIFLPTGFYAPIVINQIDSATSTIDVQMYLAHYDQGDGTPMVEAILDRLINAGERGVDVTVTLEDTQKFNSHDAYEYLTSSGVTVRYDSPEVYLHTKCITFDDRTQIVGSNNWTEPGLSANNEAAVLVDLQPAPDTYEIIAGTEYLHTCISLINNAEESIDFIIYNFDYVPSNPDAPGSRIVEALIGTIKRGVKVQGIIDSYYGEFSAKNSAAYNALLASGASVYYDPPGVVTHAKMLIVDSSRALVGSANWTRESLCNPGEMSVLINSSEFASSALEYFNSILIESKRAAFEGPEQILIPYSWLAPPSGREPGGIIRQLWDRKADKALSVFLYLLYWAQINHTNHFSLTYEELGDAMGYRSTPEHPISIHNFQSRVREWLVSLDRLGAIEYQEEGRWITLPDDALERDHSVCFGIPCTFWEYGWYRKLGFKETYFYLIDWVEYTRSSEKPIWFASGEQIHQQYGINTGAVGRAVRELHRLNLIEVMHDIPATDQPFSERLANRYLVDIPWSEDEFQARLKQEIDQHGVQLIQFAQEMATKIDDPYDINAITDFIGLTKTYGQTAVRQAVEKATSLSWGNGKWEIRYIAGILKKGYGK